MTVEQPAGLAEQFAEAGFLPAVPVLDDVQLAYFRNFSLADARAVELNTNKQLWTAYPEVLAAASSQAITAILDDLAGQTGYYLWGASLVDREPGQMHQWHSDAETTREGMVSLWIGIEGTTQQSSLSVIPGSHLAGAPVQAFWPTDDPARKDPEATALLDRVRAERGSARLDQAECRDGAGIFFDGRLWHCTLNRTDAPRRALLLQYGRNGTPVRWPRDFTEYPFRYERVHTPPVFCVRGAPDKVANKHLFLRDGGKLLAPPAHTTAAPVLDIGKDEPWKQHPYFEAETAVMKHLNCHASVLRGGFMPHLPHSHDDEEILIVLSGHAAIFAQQGKAGMWRGIPAGPGDFFYYPSGHHHTIMNAALARDASPLIYLMFRWQARRPSNSEARPLAVSSRSYRRGKGRVWLDRPSSGLGKLHIHSTRLEPGVANPRAVDRYDSAFVVLEGQLTVIERTLGPGGVFLTRTGEVHDTVNRSDAPCEYLVFEFHDRDDDAVSVDAGTPPQAGGT